MQFVKFSTLLSGQIFMLMLCSVSSKDYTETNRQINSKRSLTLDKKTNSVRVES